VFVSGKLYYELLEEREKSRDLSTALVRLEQISPFPAHLVKEILQQYSNAKKVVWAQEEPKNMGAFQFVYFKFAELMNQMGLKAAFSYVGRPERSSPATGSIYRHRAEQQQIVAEVFKI